MQCVCLYIENEIDNWKAVYIEKCTYGLEEGEMKPSNVTYKGTSLLSYYKSGVDIRRLQSILGHESISTTEIYTHIDDEALREAVKINPLSRVRNESLKSEDSEGPIQ